MDFVRKKHSDDSDSDDNDPRRELEDHEWQDAAEDDEEFQEGQLQKALRAIGAPQKITKTILSCPACFTPVCDECVPHMKQPGRFRATKVLRSCAVARKTQLTATDGGQEYTYFKVFCRECRTELGALDAEQVFVCEERESVQCRDFYILLLERIDTQRCECIKQMRQWLYLFPTRDDNSTCLPPTATEK